MSGFRSEDEILADPATENSVRQRIEADRYGRALFDGLRRHHRGADDKPPTWEELSSFERGNYWRPAIYDMLAAMGLQDHSREKAS